MHSSARVKEALLLSALLTFVACFAACATDQPEGDASKYPHAAVVGHIDAGLREAGADPLSLMVLVDGEEREVFVTNDGTFNIKELPEGQCTIELMLDDNRATTVDLTSLHAGELVELELKATPSEMHVANITRNPALRDFHYPVKRSGSLELVDSDAVFYLDPGDYRGGIDIRGHRIKVFAINHDEDCNTRERARFAGDIIVRGIDAEIFDLDTRGQVRLFGTHIRVHSPCDDLWVSDTSPSLIDNGGVTIGPRPGL